MEQDRFGYPPRGEYAWTNENGHDVIRLGDAQAVGEALNDLHPTDGPTEGITSARIVEAAKSKDSPFHGFIDWNTKEAAKQWRLHQAQMLVDDLWEKNGDHFSPMCITLDRRSYRSPK